MHLEFAEDFREKENSGQRIKRQKSQLEKGYLTSHGA